MKHLFILSLLFSLYIGLIAAEWAPQGEKIKTPWSEKINVNNVLPQYPRPIMERGSWMNLNGLWDYAIVKTGQPSPLQYDGKILVPFPIESSLSGVMKPLTGEKELYYKRRFSIQPAWKNQNILLHFGAVDWKAEVFLNGIKIGTHTGGYTPFSFDITPFLKKGEQELIVKVWDGTDNGFQPRGKQVEKPNGIWYTPVSGIWQTVWLEPVNRQHITHIKTTPDIDRQRLRFEISTEGTDNGQIFEVSILEKGKQICQGQASLGQTLDLFIEGMRLWSPDDPFLYDVEVRLISGNKTIDHIKSYAAMRKIDTHRDDNGIVRLRLNNKELFQFGPLDQGWWPDGLYTAPSDEALLYDIQKTKDLGYNMIRKHVKVEPARWYTHCDRLGLLVWQDMPNGDHSPQWQNRQYFNGQELIRTEASEQNFKKEWKEIIDYLYSYPSIVVWVPFNEAWGQFKTEEFAQWTKNYDPSRLVNPASGGNHYTTGDMLDLHNYPGPEMYLYDGQRATVLGEYGGIGLALEGHLWQPDKNWGYIQFKNSQEVTDEYIRYAEKLKKMIRTGFSAAVYTQTTDVEVEVNGLITYDRKVIKVEEDRIRKVNQEICRSLNP